jgi:hypothetical protein
VAATGTLTQAAGAAAVSATDTLTGAAFTQGASATGTLTFTQNAAANDTTTIGSTTYTYVTALTGAANQVLIGGTTGQTILNLQAAVNATSGGAGVAYGAGTVANASAYAGTATGTTLAVTANLNGAITNIASTNTGGTGHATFGATALAGGGRDGEYWRPNLHSRGRSQPHGDGE